jgi:hypothetical protein
LCGCGECVGDLFVAGELTIGRLRRARASPGRCRHRCARRRPLECEPEPPGDVGGRDEAIGANHVAGNLAAGELWPVKASSRRGQRGLLCTIQWDRAVCGTAERKGFFFLSSEMFK